MVTTYPLLHRMSVASITGAFHFFFDQFYALPTESCYTNAFPQNHDLIKKAVNIGVIHIARVSKAE